MDFVVLQAGAKGSSLYLIPVSILKLALASFALLMDLGFLFFYFYGKVNGRWGKVYVDGWFGGKREL